MSVTRISKHHPGAQGLTVVELMVALAVAAIVLSVGVPSYRDLTANQSRVAAVNELVMALNLARSHAVKSSKHVTVCRSKNSSTCGTGTGDWSEGWIVFTNTSRASISDRASEEELLRVFDPLNDSVTLTGSGASSNYIAFRPTGDTDVSTTWVYCDERGTSAAKSVVLYRSGRAEVSNKMVDGSAISCAGG